MLFRYDPFDAFDALDKRRPQMLAMDAVRNDDQVFVYFDAPGIGDGDIELSVEQQSVTVEATRRWYDADQETLTSERPQGVFRRQIQFGEHLDVDRLSASLDHGVLQLTIPVREGSKPRKVEIDTTAGEHRELQPH